MKEALKTKIARVRNDGRWHSRGSDWSTPQDLFDELDAEFHFTLDVCASDWNATCDVFSGQNGYKIKNGDQFAGLKHYLTKKG